MRRRSRAGAWLRPFLFLLLLTLPTTAQSDVVDEVARLVRKEFFDPRLRGLDWDELARQAALEERAAQGWLEVSAVVNRLLARLQTSHTRFYSPEETGFYELLGIFAPLAGNELRGFLSRTFPEGRPTYDGIGVALDAEGFLTAVWDGFPASEAGLTVGDRILEVDGRALHPILSFRGKSRVRVRVESEPGQSRVLSVPVQPLDTTRCFVTAMEKSARLIESGGRRLAYVHVWSYVGQDMQDRLGELLSRELAAGEGLVLDLRDGWGGAMPSYLNLFNERVPQMEMIDRNGRVERWDTQWRKPVVMLVNGGSRSGKEILAFGFQRYRIGAVVGSPTAGAVVGGRPYALRQGGILYVAVADVRVDGERLEGHPIQPDVRVERKIPYCQGVDPQLEKALEVLRQKIAGEVSVRCSR